MSRTPLFLRRFSATVTEKRHQSEVLQPGKLRVAITIAAPSPKVSARWGDFHFAHGFAGALERQGHRTSIQTFDERDFPAVGAADVHCVVRGLRPIAPTPGTRHVLWIISHPDEIDPAECDEADLVFVASERFAAELRTRTRTPVEVLLQATDASRFSRRTVDPRHAHDIAVVAKSRDVYRGAVRDAIAAGLEPAIYGSGWEQFVDPKLVVEQYVANEDLATVYSSIGVLLNDHWDDMRRHGFVSNRLFDALACETPVVSDDLPEIEELFDGAVLTYRDAEIRPAVETILHDRDRAHDRARRGRAIVLEHHTFDHRASEFVARLQQHDLHPNPL